MLGTTKKWKNGEKIYVVCLGDSITANNACTDDRFNYVNLLAKKLGAQAMVVNAGVSSDTILGMLNRLDRDVLVFKPDLVTVMVGMNDPAFGCGIEEFKENLKKIVEKVTETGAEIILMTQNTLLHEIKDIAERRSNYFEYVDAIRQTAKEMRVAICDVYSAFETRTGTVITKEYLSAYLPLMYDHFHPNYNGHLLIADTLFKALEIDD